ncbi:MAG TPA: S46 family peptidase, partial [Tenuifilaceae bacterium]|nr:S46 family peptidase [Tenuifilaceae bacterium]
VFEVHPKLKELWRNKDYGRYSADGKMPVCFLTDNDITGGNSGSPVLNGSGKLIGIAFDGNSEAMACDFMYEPDMQRTIIVDIRYVLFVIDKFAGAQNIINEMSIN